MTKQMSIANPTMEKIDKIRQKKRNKYTGKLMSYTETVEYAVKHGWEEE